METRDGHTYLYDHTRKGGQLIVASVHHPESLRDLLSGATPLTSASSEDSKNDASNATDVTAELNERSLLKRLEKYARSLIEDDHLNLGLNDAWGLKETLDALDGLRNTPAAMAGKQE